MLSLLELDIHTIIVMLFIGNLAAVILLLAYNGGFSKKRSFFFFIAGRILQCAAWPLLALRGNIPDIISADTGNSLLIAGFAFEALAITVAEKTDRRWEILYTVLATAGIAAFWIFASTPGLRVGIATIATICIFAAASASILYNSSGSILKKSIGVIYAVFCMILAARAFLGISSHKQLMLMSSHVVQTLSFVPLYIFMLVGGTGFLLALKEHDDMTISENEEKYRTLFDKAHDGIVIMQDGICVLVNPRMSELLGIPACQLTGMPFSGFVHPDDLELVLSSYKKRIADENPPDSYDFRALRPDGNSIWIFVTAKMIQWNGKPAVLAMLTDISARKIIEQEKERIIAELNTALSGSKPVTDMLAVCASCKKIREDDGKWKQIEMYINEKYGVDFTHSLCPDCVTKLYPDLNIES